MLWEILVPTIYEDTHGPVSTAHHREWDKVVRKIAGGLTILMPARGQWVFEGEIYYDRVIPVRIACTDKEIRKIAEFTKTHYRQLAVMYYKVSSEVHII